MDKPKVRIWSKPEINEIKINMTEKKPHDPHPGKQGPSFDGFCSAHGHGCDS